MYSLPALLILSMAWSVARGQFFYNYNQEQPVETPESEAYDPSQYKYNPPQAVEQHFIQSRQSPQDVQRTEPVSRRYQAQPAPAARYQAQPDPVVDDYQSERRQSFRAEQPPTQPVYAPEEQNNYEAPQQTDSQQSRRTSRRRHYRVRESFQEVTKPPRVYSPSVFENVGLGQAPQGVYVPEDSLLNSLRLDTPRRTRARQAGPVQQTSQLNPMDENSPSIQPVANDQPNDSPFFYQAPQQQQYRQNSFQPTSHNQQSQSTEQFFVQPPPQQHTAQPPQQAYQPTSQELQQSEEFLRQRRPSRVQYVQEQQPQIQAARPPRRQRQQSPAQRQSAPPPQAVYETPAEPIYNIDSNQVFQEDQPARRPPNRRSQEIPQQRQRTQVPRATADLETRQRTTHKDAKLAIAALPADTDGDEIPGQAGVDYPTLHVIPTTAFSCSEQPHNGYYADLETSCQVMHLCQAGGVQSSFLCPNGTIFSQEKFSCQWWYEVNCADSPRFYAINDNLYKVPVPESRSRD